MVLRLPVEGQQQRENSSESEEEPAQEPVYRARSVEKPDTDEDGGGGDCAKAVEARSGGDSQE